MEITKEEEKILTDLFESLNVTDLKTKAKLVELLASNANVITEEVVAKTKKPIKFTKTKAKAKSEDKEKAKIEILKLINESEPFSLSSRDIAKEIEKKTGLNIYKVNGLLNALALSKLITRKTIDGLSYAKLTKRGEKLV